MIQRDVRTIVVLALTFLGACGGSDDSGGGVGGNGGLLGDGGPSDSAGAAGTAGDSSSDGAAGVTSDGGTAGMGAMGGAGGVANTSPITLSYRPQWPGVTSVVVLGGFGRKDDWTMPFLVLHDDGTGKWTATANLPNGQYAYLFRVVGDADAKVPGTQMHLTIDPLEPNFVACPMGSPSASNDKNPCSELKVPQIAGQTFHQVRGTAMLDEKPAKGWLVTIERQEMGSHHFAANRTDIGDDGAFNFVVAPGTYRLQVRPPDDLKLTDAAREPLQSPWVRRAISTAFEVKADVMVGAAQVAYADYAKMKPNDAVVATPVNLMFTLVKGATMARASIYGPGMSVGDPWWDGDFGTKTSDTFDGTFNTPKASDPMAKSGTTYWWGTWQQGAKTDGGVTWTRQSLVFPLHIK